MRNNNQGFRNYCYSSLVSCHVVLSNLIYLFRLNFFFLFCFFPLVPLCSLVFFFFAPGQRRWCGTAQTSMDRDRPTTTVKPGEPATERWPAWPRPSRVASSCSRRPAAAPAPTSFSASRTPSYHSPKNKSLICFVFCFFFCIFFRLFFWSPLQHGFNSTSFFTSLSMWRRCLHWTVPAAAETL